MCGVAWVREGNGWVVWGDVAWHGNGVGCAQPGLVERRVQGERGGVKCGGVTYSRVAWG